MWLSIANVTICFTYCIYCRMSSCVAFGSKTTLYENTLGFLSPLLVTTSHCEMKDVVFHLTRSLRINCYRWRKKKWPRQDGILRTTAALTYICPSPGNCTTISSPDLISLLLSGRTLKEGTEKTVSQ
ncbi:hypothetical protein PUN28_004355 [Cardiocondyla obscurior]|uniref:Secreted protein n=1 Tax=Cardiocondyla obscurior TaxID=286306 RepID=A0AAW2GAY4_9HYME